MFGPVGDCRPEPCMSFGFPFFLYALVAMSALAGAVGQTGGAASSSPSPAASNTATIVYKNTQYDFCFALPESWNGYTVVEDTWKGKPLDTGAQVSGPLLRIRHPGWTERDPYEDIPVMVFTRAEWQRVENNGLSVSAAPIGPKALGRNRRYVFALPARYNFDNARGWEEVDRLIRSHALKAPCPR
jgi:hypothetical protein